MRFFWIIIGLASVALGIIGVVLPLLPTVPFFLLAAFCFARSSERLHNWLLDHPQFGPAIIDWRDSRAIGRRAKWAATVSIAAVFMISLILDLRPLILIIQGMVLSLVLLFIWTRPDA